MSELRKSMILGKSNEEISQLVGGAYKAEILNKAIKMAPGAEGNLREEVGSATFFKKAGENVLVRRQLSEIQNDKKKSEEEKGAAIQQLFARTAVEMATGKQSVESLKSLNVHDLNAPLVTSYVPEEIRTAVDVAEAAAREEGHDAPDYIKTVRAEAFDKARNELVRKQTEEGKLEREGVPSGSTETGGSSSGDSIGGGSTTSGGGAAGSSGGNGGGGASPKGGGQNAEEEEEAAEPLHPEEEWTSEELALLDQAQAIGDADEAEAVRAAKGLDANTEAELANIHRERQSGASSEDIQRRFGPKLMKLYNERYKQSLAIREGLQEGDEALGTQEANNRRWMEQNAANAQAVETMAAAGNAAGAAAASGLAHEAGASTDDHHIESTVNVAGVNVTIQMDGSNLSPREVAEQMGKDLAEVLKRELAQETYLVTNYQAVC